MGRWSLFACLLTKKSGGTLLILNPVCVSNVQQHCRAVHRHSGACQQLSCVSHTTSSSSSLSTLSRLSFYRLAAKRDLSILQTCCRMHLKRSRPEASRLVDAKSREDPGAAVGRSDEIIGSRSRHPLKPTSSAVCHASWGASTC